MIPSVKIKIENNNPSWRTILSSMRRFTTNYRLNEACGFDFTYRSTAFRSHVEIGYKVVGENVHILIAPQAKMHRFFFSNFGYETLIKFGKSPKALKNALQKELDYIANVVCCYLLQSDISIETYHEYPKAKKDQINLLKNDLSDTHQQNKKYWEIDEEEFQALLIESIPYTEDGKPIIIPYNNTYSNEIVFFDVASENELFRQNFSSEFTGQEEISPEYEGISPIMKWPSQKWRRYCSSMFDTCLLINGSDYKKLTGVDAPKIKQNHELKYNL